MRPLSTAQYCDFPWLGYYYDKTEEEYKELEVTREKLKDNPTIDGLLSKLNQR